MKILAASAELDEIIGHMEADRLSISPYSNGYIIAKGSKEEKKLKLLDPKWVQLVPSPHENYLFVIGEYWQKVKHVRQKTTHMKV